MAWLQPWAWLGLGALVVPVLVHLLSRRPARTEAFPSLRFLAATPLRPTRRTRISDWPLLLVRLLVLLAAAAALAQPVRRTALASAAGAVSRVRLVDTLTTAVPAGVDSVETLLTASLPEGLARAVARLGARPAPRSLEVVSTFAAGVADSAMFSPMPRDVALVLTPARVANRATPGAPTAVRHDTLRWRSTLAPAARDAVRRAVASLGGAPVDARAVTGEAATPLQEIIIPQVMFSGADSLARGATAEAVRRVAADPVLRALTTYGAAVQVTRRGDSLRVVVESASPDVALALLMAAGGAPSPSMLGGAAPDTAALRRWASLPSGAPIGEGAVATDVHRVVTEARWLWLAVLVLMGVEWAMRRAARTGTEAGGRAPERA
jgi:hypothetical protein